MKNYLNKSTFKGIKRDLAEKYGVGKSDEIWRYANSEYHKLETYEPDADKACPLYDKAKELGTPEAVQMICCMDKEYMNGFRGVDYQRTKSVAEGDDCCDYRLDKSV